MHIRYIKNIILLALCLATVGYSNASENILAYSGASGPIESLYTPNFNLGSKAINVGTSVTSLGNFTYNTEASFILGQTKSQSSLEKYFDLQVSGNKFTCTNPIGRWYTITIQAFWGGVNPTNPVPNRTLLVSGGTPTQSPKTGWLGISTVKYETTIGSGHSLTSRFYVKGGQCFYLEGICDLSRSLQLLSVYITD